MKELTCKEIQSVSLEILRYISDICEKNNIKYYMMYGTLIGAVRHQGFIPWDDDIDIMMPRKDYSRFISVFENMKTVPYELFYAEKNSEYPYMIGRVSDSRYLISTRNEVDYGMGVFVDIYPFDGLGSDIKIAKKIAKKADFYSSMHFLSTRIGITNQLADSSSKLRLLVKIPAFVIAKIFGKKYWKDRLNNLSNLYDYENSKYVSIVVWECGWKKEIYPKSWFEESVKLTFEGYEFMAPKQYDVILSSYYGDYMQLPPVEKRIGHHEYRAFQKQ